MLRWSRSTAARLGSQHTYTHTHTSYDTSQPSLRRPIRARRRRSLSPSLCSLFGWPLLRVVLEQRLSCSTRLAAAAPCPGWTNPRVATSAAINKRNSALSSIARPLTTVGMSPTAQPQQQYSGQTGSATLLTPATPLRCERMLQAGGQRLTQRRSGAFCVHSQGRA